MQKIYDLHTHSSFSDGYLPFNNLAKYLKSFGVTDFAITDHDCLFEGVINLDMDINVIPGIEVTTSWQDISVHIVGLNLKGSNELLSLAKNNQSLRLQRAKGIDDTLSKLGYTGSLDYILKNMQPKSIGRVHFARFLVDKKIVNGMGQAFKSILNVIELPRVSWPSLLDVISAIHSGGGYAVIAHPLKYKLSDTQIKKLVEDFSLSGGDAIEYISGKTIYRDLMKIHDIASEYNLKGSCGSDFHTSFAKNIFQHAKYNNWLNEFQPIWNEWEKT